MPRPYLLGHIITLLTSFLFFYGGQAHLADRYTPDLSRAIGRQAEGASRAWWWFDLDPESVRLLSTLVYAPDSFGTTRPLERSTLLIVLESMITWVSDNDIASSNRSCQCLMIRESSGYRGGAWGHTELKKKRRGSAKTLRSKDISVSTP